MNSLKTLNLLTFLRFLAAAWVFFDHFGKDILADIPYGLACLVPHGLMAVTFFFILSGFVLSYSNTSERKLTKTVPSFLMARFARIYPVYFAALLIPLPHKLWELRHSLTVLREFYPLPLVLTLTQSWIPKFANAWNPPAWSLSVEALFYLSFPLIILFTSKIKTYRLLMGSILIVLICEFLRGSLLGAYPATAKYFPVVHLPLFLLGIALGRLFLEANRPLPVGLAWLVVFLGIIYLELFFFENSRIQWILPVIACAFGGVILCSANLSGQSLLTLQKPVPVLLGEASYGFYITHLPVMIGFQRFVEICGFQHPERSMSVMLVGFVVCTAVSVIIHLLIEKPARTWLLERLPRAS